MREGSAGTPAEVVVPEVQRAFPVGKVGDGVRVVVEASVAECRALAGRMRLVAVQSLTCRFDLRREVGDCVAAAGMLRAVVVQSCVVSLEAFEAEVVESFSLRFVPEGTERDDLDLESDDEVPYAGGVLELGEAASEQLALALDPFPRRPGAEMEEVAEEMEGGAFAGLGKLLPRQ